ncbi:hypothetical protein EDD18DRAFT_1111115 [Armillaria luteobubalina]|uniref:Uncharacterized protein n=1 Tax=Armillaria luteobubalina TaxID=153913 RepID=A0AA39PP45_9AGAR|nr:hypothetical protein EDD18DRAFT_1111115 [Armillaria luteobubalina]
MMKAFRTSLDGDCPVDIKHFPRKSRGMSEVLSDKDLEDIVAHTHLGFEFFLPSIDKLINNPLDATGLNALAMVLGNMVASVARFPHSDVQSEYEDWVECKKLIEYNMEWKQSDRTSPQQMKPLEIFSDFVRFQSLVLCGILVLIRATEALRLPRITSNEGSGQGAVQTELADAAKKSWISPYIGDCPATLLTDINSHIMAAYAQGHRSSGTMIQSSGTAYPEPDTIKLQDGLKILIYFDEADTLAIGTSGPTNYEALCLALADIEGFNHFIIFISTTGALRIPGHPQHEYRSSRAATPRMTLPAPFTILPFDIGPRVLHKQATFEMLQSIKHLAAFGRPMWHIMLAAGTSLALLILLAQCKLTHRDQGSLSSIPPHRGVKFYPPMEQLKEVVQMALMCIRQEKSHHLQEEMVTGHMRIALSVPSHREYMKSGYPSEPILAEAAVISIYEESYLEQILQSTPDNQLEGKVFSDVFEHGYVHFMHFGHAGSSDAINSASSLAAFICSMAFQCCSGHPVIDILIPVLIIPKDVATQPNFNIDELTLNKFHRSCLLISVKDRENAERGNYTINAESLNSCQVPKWTQTPLSVTSKDDPTRSTRQSDSFSKAHPRYSIIISGCSSTVYNVISLNEKAIYFAMLAPQGMLHEHPYNNEESLILLRKMKPFWNLGPARFDWVDISSIGIVPNIMEMEYVPTIMYGDQAVIIEGDDGTLDVKENNAADIWHDI